MKSTAIAGLALALSIASATFPAAPAAALSCLPTDMYLQDVVGDEDVVIFTGTVTETMKEKTYTAEVIEVGDVHQGYVAANTFVYHQLDETWGYLCNPGPSDQEGTESVYVASRDNYGKLMVSQRLTPESDLTKTLMADLTEAAVTGEVLQLSTTDRMNQIITTLSEMLAEMMILLTEHTYWKGAK